MDGHKPPPGWQDGDARGKGSVSGLDPARTRQADDDDPLRGAHGILTWMAIAILFWLIVGGVVWVALRRSPKGSSSEPAYRRAS